MKDPDKTLPLNDAGAARSSEGDAMPPGPEDRYDRREEIARGGMGAIYLVADRELRRDVAMKVVLSAGDSDLDTRFVEEAQITGQLEHPNIVPVHELGTRPDGKAYFTMKLVKGESLQQIIDRLAEGGARARAEHPLAESLRVFLRILDAVGFAHSRGVVHRDLKPENVMVGSFGEVQVMDWGLAKVLSAEETGPSSQVGTDRSEAGAGLTLAGDVMGTPGYMPPEQASGRMDEVNETSDIFALGGILHALLVHEPPHTGGNAREVLKKAVRCRIKPLGARFPSLSVPAELDSICLKALAADPEERYGSSEEMGDDVRAFLEKRLVRAHRYGMWARTARFIQRHPSATVASAAISIVLVISAAVVGIVLSQLETAKERARAQEARRVEAESRTTAETALRREAEATAKTKELLRKNAEVEKRLAQQEARDAKEDLQKSRIVSGLLRAAHVEIGGVAGALKRLVRTPMPLEERSRKRETLWMRIDRYERESVGKDDTSWATWLAVKGWILWNEARFEEARLQFAKSRETDPEVVYGWLFDAMAQFSYYISMESYPAYSVGSKGITWNSKPTETGRQPEFRERFEERISHLKEGRIWGETAAEDFLEVLGAFLSYYTGDVAKAAAAMGRALAIPEMAWIADELFFARAKARLHLYDFEGALEDLDRAIAMDSMGGTLLHYKAQTLQMMGHAEEFAGRDPVPHWKECIKLFDEAERRFPGMQYYHQPRGQAKLGIARALRKRGEDPREMFSKAIEDFTAGTWIRKGQYAWDFNISVALMGRSSAYGERAAWLRQQGEDPGPGWRKSLEDALESHCYYLPSPFGTTNLRKAFIAYGRHLVRTGKRPSLVVEKLLADLAGEFAGGDEAHFPTLKRALILEMLGRYEEALPAFLSLQGSDRVAGLGPRIDGIRKRASIPKWFRIADQAQTLAHMWDVEAALTKLLEAVATVEKTGTQGLPRGIEHHAELHVGIARLLAFRSTGRKTPKDDPPVTPPPGAEARRAKAIDHLEKALALGFSDTGMFAKDDELRPLRDHPRFKKLLGK
ncbi:MAG: protein kinase domain-containing protein [Planctomycetota bacterium]|jgi:tetratricopeptide (TPR) repeat protein